MFGRRIPLFTILGLRIAMDVSWIVLTLLITLTLARGAFPYRYPELMPAAYWAMGLMGALGLFFSLLFHEMSHALTARRYGIPIRGITLFIFGGVAEMEAEPASPWAEFEIAIIGPVMSVTLGLVAAGLHSVAETWLWPVPIVGVLSYLATINFVLAAFNLLPAFPLDGGRILRATIWKRKGNFVQATRIASKAGAGFGYTLVVLGVIAFSQGHFISGMWWALVGLFLKDAARHAYYQLVMQELLAKEPVLRFLKPLPSAQMGDPKRLPLETTISANAPASEVLIAMNRAGIEKLSVVENGRLLGTVSMKDILADLSLQLASEKKEKLAA